MMGHTTLKTTQIYMQMDMDDIIDEYKLKFTE